MASHLADRRHARPLSCFSGFSWPAAWPSPSGSRCRSRPWPACSWSGVFIIFHDCGHGSFFGSRLANDVAGFIAGMLTFTPYYHWRWEHSLHHATAGDLDRRGAGDVWTMTVHEYLESSRWKRFAYRLARNPIVLFVLAPVFVFVVLQRFPSAKANSRERKSVIWMNLATLGMATALSWVFGLVPYLLIQPPGMISLPLAAAQSLT